MMIEFNDTFIFEWVGVPLIVLEQVEKRDINKVRFFLELLENYPDKETTPIFVIQEPTGYYVIEEGHHRFLAHVIAGRSKIACLVRSRK